MKGYTLIEILIVIIILLIISNIILAYNKNTQLNVLVLTEQLKIKSFFNQAKNFALEKKNININNISVCGYGLNLNPKKVIIFADLSNNCFLTDKIYKEQEDFKISEYVLNNNLELRDELNNPISNINFLFVGPYLNIYQNNNLLLNEYKFYVINLKDQNKKALIKIGPEGKISTID